jgi:hypothetical protein
MRTPFSFMLSGILALGLSACSGLDVDYAQVDVASLLPTQYKSGKVGPVDVPKGSFDAGTTPALLSATLDLSTKAIPVKISSAQLKPTVTLEHNIQGSGKLSLQVFLAPATVSALDSMTNTYKLGSPIEVDIAKATQALSNDLTLSSTQLEAINAKKVRISLKLLGSASSTSATAAEFKYSVEKLVLTATGSTAAK